MTDEPADEELDRLAREIRDGLRGTVVRDRVAKALDIPAYEWLSPESVIETDIEEFRETLYGVPRGGASRSSRCTLA
jgi:hypothetical protein